MIALPTCAYIDLRPYFCLIRPKYRSKLVHVTNTRVGRVLGKLSSEEIQIQFEARYGYIQLSTYLCRAAPKSCCGGAPYGNQECRYRHEDFRSRRTFSPGKPGIIITAFTKFIYCRFSQLYLRVLFPSKSTTLNSRSISTYP